MNFEAIKSGMERQSGRVVVPDNVRSFEESSMPIQVIRRRMRIEIKALLIGSVIGVLVGFFTEMNPVLHSIYLSAALLSAVVNGICIRRLNYFLREQISVATDSFTTVRVYVDKLELTLALYKMMTFLSSLFLVVATLAMYLRRASAMEQLTNWFRQSSNTASVFLISGGSLLVVAVLYGLILLNTNLVYGRQLQKLKAVLQSFEE